MTLPDWRQLVVLSLKDPASAARTLIGLELPRDVLWTGLTLAAVANAILLGVSNLMYPAPAAMPAIMMNPLYYVGFVLSGLVLSTYALYWAGRVLGGKGTLSDVLVLLIWLQFLRILLQVVTLVMMMISPLLTALMLLGSIALGIYIMLHFVNVAHKLQSLGRAAGVLIATAFAIVLVLSMLIAMFGTTLLGTINNV